MRQQIATLKCSGTYGVTYRSTQPERRSIEGAGEGSRNKTSNAVQRVQWGSMPYRGLKGVQRRCTASTPKSAAPGASVSDGARCATLRRRFVRVVLRIMISFAVSAFIGVLCIPPTIGEEGGGKFMQALALCALLAYSVYELLGTFSDGKRKEDEA